MNGKKWKIGALCLLAFILLAGCGHTSPGGSGEDGTPPAETAAADTENKETAEKAEGVETTDDSPYNRRTESDPNAVWYLAENGVHRLDKADGTDELFLASETLTVLDSWNNWLYVTDSADVDEAHNMTVWKVDKATGEKTETAVTVGGFAVIGDRLWLVERIPEADGTLSPTGSCQLGGYTLNGETGEPEDGPLTLDYLRKNQSALYPAFEAYDYLVMGEDLSSRLIRTDNETFYGEIDIEDVQTQATRYLMDGRERIFYGGPGSIVFEEDQCIYECHTDTGTTEPVVSGLTWSARLFGVDAAYFYLSESPDSVTEDTEEGWEQVVFRVSRETGEKEELLTIRNVWSDDRAGQMENGDIPVGEFVEDWFVYYDSAKDQVLAVKAEVE